MKQLKISCMAECNTLVFQDESKKVLYCDTSLNLQRDNLVRKQFGYGNPSVLIDKDFENNFYIQFKDKKRWMRPDLIIKDETQHKNMLNLLQDKKILLFKKEDIKGVLFSAEKINLKITLREHYEENSLMPIANRIFKVFDDRLSNLYRTKNITRGSLKGYQHKCENNIIVVKNLSKMLFDNIYQEVFNMGEEKSSDKYDFYIIDWKYVNQGFFDKNSDKLKIDFIKQLTYEFCLLNNSSISGSIKSQFVIPHFSLTNNIILEKPIETDEAIDIIKLNFRLAQEVYLNEY